MSIFTTKNTVFACAAILLSSILSEASCAQDIAQRKLADASLSISRFFADGTITSEVLDSAYGIAVIPNVVRAGFILGARRGKGVLVTRTSNGTWSNPAFIQLTGGSIGWQIGAESAELVIVFANEASIRNIADGRFTLTGDATAIAGPTGRRSTAAVMFKSEVYAYVKSKGLFAGASLEGTRLAMDPRTNTR